MGINPRKKGHAYERDVRDFFIKLGWPTCVTSRLESKRADDAGVDLCFTDPFNVQAKAVENLGSIHAVLDRMPVDSNLNVVFHKKNRQGTIVAMKQHDFEKIVALLKQNNLI